MRGMLPRFSLRTAFLLWTAAAFLCFAAFGVQWCLGPIVSQSTLGHLKVGMTTEEVERLLGPPDELGETGYWAYERALNPGWLTVTFNEEGRLVNYNHETAYP